MINDIRIHLAIIMYMGGCLSLMIYNAIVIFHKRSIRRAMLYNTDKWIKTIHQQLTDNIGTFTKKHEKHLVKSLSYVENLIAFSNALNYLKLEYGNNFYNEYMDMLVQRKIFLILAVAYKKKKNEERAYFAYFVAQHPLVAKNTGGICTHTIDTMVSYIESSDIYCRVNVLKALCTIGDIHGIINILQFFSDKFYFIHHKLLAEDLFSFAGDKEVLALYLWGKYKVWNNNIILGVITFITMFSDGFTNAFLPVLQNPLANAEIRIAIIRYYSKYSFSPAQSILVEYLNQTDNYDIAAEAASALRSHPGNVTTIALTSALQSDNWYVRYNAAASLAELGEFSNSIINASPDSNSDAIQIIQYMVEHIGVEKHMNVSELII